METVHVIPINDLREHSASSSDCPCWPDVQIVDGGEVIVHRSWDGREILEQAADAAFGGGRN